MNSSTKILDSQNSDKNNSHLIYIIAVALLIIIVLNIVGINNPDIWVYGMYILITVASMLISRAYSLKHAILYSLGLFFFNKILSICIDTFFDYTTVTDEGVTIPFIIKILAILIESLITVVIATVFGFLVKIKAK